MWKRVITEDEVIGLRNGCEDLATISITDLSVSPTLGEGQAPIVVVPLLGSYVKCGRIVGIKRLG